MRPKDGIDGDTSQILNLDTYHQVIWQRRLMLFATALAILGIGIYVFAIFRPDWSILDFVNTNSEHVNVQLGVWGEWRTLNTSSKPEWIPHFPKPPGKRLLRLAGQDLKREYHQLNILNHMLLLQTTIVPRLPSASFLWL
jgi:hypothetical protein